MVPVTRRRFMEAGIAKAGGRAEPVFIGDDQAAFMEEILRSGNPEFCFADRISRIFAVCRALNSQIQVTKAEVLRGF